MGNVLVSDLRKKGMGAGRFKGPAGSVRYVYFFFFCYHNYFMLFCFVLFYFIYFIFIFITFLGGIFSHLYITPKI